MKCRNLLTLLLLVATNSVAASVSDLKGPVLCAFPVKTSQTVQFHSSSAEILNPLKRPDPIVPLGCERPFLYQNEIYSADSPQAQDGSGLKFMMRSVPEAEAMMKQYQDNRRNTKIFAYVGTFAILVALLATPIAKRIERSPSWHAEHLAEVIRYTAFTFAAADLAYSFSLLSDNESLIPKAVDRFNHAKPNDPIELKFTAGWRF